jgi:hypothetical protein|eukprot:COSAG01_NODE_1071_length_11863_cov_36.887623_8_plen_34_part_00
MLAVARPNRACFDQDLFKSDKLLNSIHTLYCVT